MQYINNNKLQNIKENPTNFYVTIDFDKTITSVTSSDSWDASANRKVLGNQIADEMQELYKKYAPIELDYSLNFEEKKQYMIEWYSKCMDLYFKYNLTKDKLTSSIDTSKVEFRPGAKEFLIKMHKNNIPVIILSAGIGNVIEYVLKKNGCYFENMEIISNFIKFDNQGNITKFDNNKMIHTLNKTTEGHISNKMQDIIVKKKYKLLLGDLVEDKNMISQKEWPNTLTIGFLNSNIETNKEIYNKNFDIVLIKEEASFYYIDKLLFN